MTNSVIENVVLLENLTDRTGRIYNRDEILSELSKGVSYYGILGYAKEAATFLDKVSHLVKNLRMEGNNVVGDIVILRTPMGEMLSRLRENGIEFQTAMRAVGVVDDHRRVTELTLEGFDMVPKETDATLVSTLLDIMDVRLP